MKENEMVFGIRAVIEAIQADKEVDKILVKRDLQGWADLGILQFARW